MFPDLPSEPEMCSWLPSELVLRDPGESLPREWPWPRGAALPGVTLPPFPQTGKYRVIKTQPP